MGDQPLFQALSCGPCLVVHKCGCGILLELPEGNLLPKRSLDRSCLIDGTLSLSPASVFLWRNLACHRSGCNIKRHLTLVSPSPITLFLLSSHGPGPGELRVILGCRHKFWGEG